MSADDTFLKQVIAMLARALVPFATATASPTQLAALLARLGWPAPKGNEVAARLSGTASAINRLAKELDGGAGAAALVAAVGEAMRALAALRTVSLGPSAGAPFSDPAFWRRLPDELLALLVSEGLEAEAPGLYGMLAFLGVLRKRSVVADASAGRSAYVARTVDWAVLGRAAASPRTWMADVYGWGGRFDHARFLDALAALGPGLGAATSRQPPHPALLAPYVAPDNPDRGAIRALSVSPFVMESPTLATLVKPALLVLPLPPQPSPSQPPQGLLLWPMVSGAAQATVDLGPAAKLTLEGDFQATPLRMELQPGGTTTEKAPTSRAMSARVDITPAKPFIVVGSSDGARIELTRAHFGISASGAGSDSEVVIDAALDEACAVLDFGGADNFLRNVLGDGQSSLSLAAGITWSSLTGLTFSGSPQPSLTIPTNIRIAGVLSVSEIQVGLQKADADAARVTVSVTGGFELGPFSATVEHMGLQVLAAPATLDAPGNFGLVDLSFGFKPPDRIGLAIAAGSVSGGGYLKIDADAGEYAGVLDLDILSVGVSAIGLVNTKLPQGGWSLFLALFIELPSIQLGFGFTLNGVGGLAGVNRTIDPDGLRSAIRSGSLDSVLFPEDPIREAPRIIDAVQAIFPSAPNRYVFGPVIKIGWGTPPLIEAVIGIAISFPDPITLVVMGSVTSVLPNPDTELVALHLDVGGGIDMGSGALWVDSSLHDSHIVGFPLSGDMALRAEFGEAPSFLMALGGYHPGFKRPHNFPELDRLSLAINAGKLIDIRFECYFAISSNSLQFGSAFELTAEVEGFGISGRAEFDALVIFSPFSLKTNLSFHISVEAVGVDLLAVWLDVRLSGPNPWLVVGTATFTILGIDNHIKLDQRIGSAKREPPPLVEDVLGQVLAALALPEAWSIGPGGGCGVTFAGDEPQSDELVVAPDGTLGVSQRVVPLEVGIDKSVPWQIEGEYTSFNIEADGPGMASTGDLNDWFALSSYKDLKPHDQLSAPSFESLKSGIEFGSGSLTAGPARTGTLDYEPFLRDPELGDATVKLPTLNWSNDPRPEITGSKGRATSVYTIAADDAPITVAAKGFVTTDRLTGAVLGQKTSWAASLMPTAKRKLGTTVAPTWEVIK